MVYDFLLVGLVCSRTKGFYDSFSNVFPIGGLYKLRVSVL